MREYPRGEDRSAPRKHPKVSDKIRPPGCLLHPGAVSHRHDCVLEEDCGDLPEEEIKCDFGCLEVSEDGVFSYKMDDSGEEEDDGKS